jgi:predicted nucleic acid-binding protein
MQTECLKEGINGIGIPDLIIAQNAKQKDVAVYSLDKYFVFLQNILKIKLYPETD